MMSIGPGWREEMDRNVLLTDEALHRSGNLSDAPPKVIVAAIDTVMTALVNRQLVAPEVASDLSISLAALVRDWMIRHADDDASIADLDWKD